MPGLLVRDCVSELPTGGCVSDLFVRGCVSELLVVVLVGCVVAPRRVELGQDGAKLGQDVAKTRQTVLSRSDSPESSSGDWRPRALDSYEFGTAGRSRQLSRDRDAQNPWSYIPSVRLYYDRSEDGNERPL